MVPSENTFKHLLVYVWSQLAQGTQEISYVQLARLKKYSLTSGQCWRGKHIGKSPDFNATEVNCKEIKVVPRNQTLKIFRGVCNSAWSSGWNTFSCSQYDLWRHWIKTHRIWDPVLDPNLEDSHTDPDVSHQGFSSTYLKKWCLFFYIWDF